MYIIIGIFTIAFGIVAIIRPATFYEINEWWKSDGGEPSDFYLATTRLGGIGAIIIGIAAIILQVFIMVN
jgi:hypothetical protein